MDADGSNQTYLYGGKLETGENASVPNWTPDGKIGFGVFVKYGRTEYASDIFLISPDGSGLINVTRTRDRDERSPDFALISPSDDAGPNEGSACP